MVDKPETYEQDTYSRTDLIGMVSYEDKEKERDIGDRLSEVAYSIKTGFSLIFYHGPKGLYNKLIGKSE